MTAPTITSGWVTGLEPPVTRQANDMDRVWDLFLYIGLGVLAFVVVLVLYIMVRFRRRDDRLPVQKHYNIPMEVTYTLIPFLLIAVLFAVTVVSVWAIEETDDDPDLVVHVTGFQWQWQFDYPDSGVTIIGGPEIDGAPRPELVLPANSSVLFELESLDVIHSFWVTVFRFKHDMIPGTVRSFSVDTTGASGYYPNAGVCAEYCGLDHALMQFSVRVLPPDEFAAWIDEQTLAGESATQAAGAGT